MTCAICMNDMPVENIELECKHKFCMDCIFNWMMVKRNCPCCRKDITAEYIERRVNEEEGVEEEKDIDEINEEIIRNMEADGWSMNNDLNERRVRIEEERRVERRFEIESVDMNIGVIRRLRNQNRNIEVIEEEVAVLNVSDEVRIENDNNIERVMNNRRILIENKREIENLKRRIENLERRKNMGWGAYIKSYFK